jgi:hypothetical protein
MNFKRLCAVAAVSAMFASPAFATTFSIDFEKSWDFGLGDIDNFYNGGAAQDGSTGGPNLGVAFVNVSGLSNQDGFPASFSNAPTPLGVAYAHDVAYMNVASGVSGPLSFFYSAPQDALDAIKVYSGLNGTGTLLGQFSLGQNNTGAYDVWTPMTIQFSGTAMSFDFTGSANNVAFDNIKAVPLPPAALLFGSALLGVPALRRKAKRA